MGIGEEVRRLKHEIKLLEGENRIHREEIRALEEARLRAGEGVRTAKALDLPDVERLAQQMIEVLRAAERRVSREAAKKQDTISAAFRQIQGLHRACPHPVIRYVELAPEEVGEWGTDEWRRWECVDCGHGGLEEVPADDYLRIRNVEEGRRLQAALAQLYTVATNTRAAIEATEKELAGLREYCPHDTPTVTPRDGIQHCPVCGRDTRSEDHA